MRTLLSLSALFVAVHARFARELALLPPGVEVVVFSGGGETTATYRDFSASAELIEEGRAEVANVLDRVDAEAAGLPALDASPGPLVAVNPGPVGH